jgi:hypothetical protein
MGWDEKLCVVLYVVVRNLCVRVDAFDAVQMQSSRNAGYRRTVETCATLRLE